MIVFAHPNASEETPMTLWLQPATYDTRAPGVATFGQTSTVDRRCDWAKVFGYPTHRDSLIRTGLRAKDRWALRFMWRANGVSERIGRALGMVFSESETERRAAA